MNKNILILSIILFIFISISYFNIYETFQEYDSTKNAKLIMNAHHSGFFCNFNRLIHYLTLYPNVTQIDFNIISRINNHKPYIADGVEIFSQLFEIYDTKEKIDVVYDIDGNDFKKMPSSKGAYEVYNSNRNKLDPYNKAFKKYIILKPHLQITLDDKIKELHQDCEQVIGIFVRSQALASEQPTDKMPTRDDYLNAINKIDTKSKKTKYFLRIDNEEDLEFYKSKLQPNFYTDMHRAKTNKGDAPHSSDDKFLSLKDLEDTYLDIAILSSCEYLVHCVSNMATASLFMNMSQVSICVSEPGNSF